jgi:predicted molibdopterin-dependent oxidoreductase YjgC
MTSITIDGKTYRAEKGASVLAVARAHRISIPTLCYHPALKPSGSCKLCAVETVAKHGRRTTMLSCIMKVRGRLEVKTSGDLVDKARRRAFKRLFQMAPQSIQIRRLAEDFGVDTGTPPDGCIRCHLCIRVCKEIVGAGALKMVTRKGVKLVTPIDGRCVGCGTCANLCPTNAIVVTDSEDVRTITVRDDVIGRHPLVRCEGCGKRFATPRYIDLIEDKRRMDHPDVKLHHHYCPTCAKLFSDRVQAIKSKPQKLRLPGHR